MVVLGGLGIAAVAIGAGALGSILFGGSSKKEQTVSPSQSADVITYPYAHYAPVTSKTYQPAISHQLDYVYAPSIQIESPGAVGATVETKKEAAQTPSSIVSPVIDQGGVISQPSQEASASQTDSMSIIIIGAIILIGGYAVIKMTGKKKARRKN